jgi:hypothetical protein
VVRNSLRERYALPRSKSPKFRRCSEISCFPIELIALLIVVELRYGFDPANI